MTELTSHVLPRILLIVLGLAAVVLGSWVGAIDGPGQLKALGTLRPTEVRIMPEVSARIRDVLVVEGQRVETGAPLVRLDDDLPQLRYRMADVAERLTLQLELPKYVLAAPLAGVILRRNAEPGEVAVPGVPLLILADMAQLELTTHLPQSDLHRIYVGQPVAVEAESLRGVIFPARVATIAGIPESVQRNALTTSDRLDLVFAVKVRLTQADPRLKPGVSAVARFEE